jgi:hypothetical protein
LIQIVLIIGLIIIFGVVLQWYLHSSPAAAKNALKRFLLYFGVLVLLVLTVTGRLGWLLPVLGGVLAMLARSFPHLIRLAPVLQRLWIQYRAARPQTRTQNVSTVETEFIRMTLDHDLGEISGEVLKGRFAGRALNELNLKSLLQLRAEVIGLDNDSVALIESYLDRIYPNDWQRAQSSQEEPKRDRRRPGDENMTRAEALEILGLPAGSSSSDIIAAHRRLIQKIHPDRGGSGYLAAKINQARDVLLG